MTDKVRQSSETKPPTLSMSEAIARLKNGAGSPAAAAPAEAGNAKRAAPTPEPQPDGLEPDVTNLDPEESDAGGSVDEADPDVDEGDGADETDDAKDPLIALMIDGEEVEVPLSELAVLVKKGTDYTNKTKALAESRRAVDQQASEIAAERDALKADRSAMQKARQVYEVGLAAFERTVAGPAEQWAQVDWNQLREDDPLEYTAKWADYQRHKENVAWLQDEARRLDAEKQEEGRRAHAESLKTLRTEIGKALPHWSDETVRTKEFGAMVKTAKSFGFTDDEINATIDPRIFLMLHKAMKYDRQAATRASATSPAPNRVPGRGAALPPAKVVPPSGARPVIRAGNRSGNSLTVRDAVENLKKTAQNKGGNSIKAGVQVLVALRQAAERSSRR